HIHARLLFLTELQLSYVIEITVPSTPIMMFIVKDYARNRDLHSFPTRRSSDLVGTLEALEHPLLRGADGLLANAARAAPHSPERSEEHTSELQSRGHVVCRLQLEKKKLIICLLVTVILCHVRPIVVHSVADILV